MSTLGFMLGISRNTTNPMKKNNFNLRIELSYWISPDKPVEWFYFRILEQVGTKLYVEVHVDFSLSQKFTKETIKGNF